MPLYLIHSSEDVRGVDEAEQPSTALKEGVMSLERDVGKLQGEVSSLSGNVQQLHQDVHQVRVNLNQTASDLHAKMNATKSTVDTMAGSWKTTLRMAILITSIVAPLVSTMLWLILHIVGVDV